MQHVNRHVGYYDRLQYFIRLNSIRGHSVLQTFCLLGHSTLWTCSSFVRSSFRHSLFRTCSLRLTTSIHSTFLTTGPPVNCLGLPHPLTLLGYQWRYFLKSNHLHTFPDQPVLWAFIRFTVSSSFSDFYIPNLSYFDSHFLLFSLAPEFLSLIHI